MLNQIARCEMALPGNDRFHPYSYPDGIRPNVPSSSPAAGRCNTTTILPSHPVQRPPCAATATAPHPLQATLDKIMGGINTISTAVSAMKTEQEKHAKQLDDLIQSSFTIEKSGYKVRHCNNDMPA